MDRELTEQTVVRLLMDRLDQIESRMTNEGNRVNERLTNHGEEMRQGFMHLADKLELHDKDDKAVETRVHTIEVERAGEKATALKNAGWTATVIVMSYEALRQAIGHFWK